MLSVFVSVYMTSCCVLIISCLVHTLVYTFLTLLEIIIFLCVQLCLHTYNILSSSIQLLSRLLIDTSIAPRCPMLLPPSMHIHSEGNSRAALGGVSAPHKQPPPGQPPPARRGSLGGWHKELLDAILSFVVASESILRVHLCVSADTVRAQDCNGTSKHYSSFRLDMGDDFI